MTGLHKVISQPTLSRGTGAAKAVPPIRRHAAFYRTRFCDPGTPGVKGYFPMVHTTLADSMIFCYQKRSVILFFFLLLLLLAPSYPP